jgi:hypothetical protein
LRLRGRRRRRRRRRWRLLYRGTRRRRRLDRRWRIRASRSAGNGGRPTTCGRDGRRACARRRLGGAIRLRSLRCGVGRPAHSLVRTDARRTGRRSGPRCARALRRSRGRADDRSR